jgi:hypothetical protein
MASRADQRKFHYIYKITRTDGKYYIGMHSTNDLEDGYFGSGQLLWKSVMKHGKENHIKEILEYLPTRNALKTRERELVNKEMLGDKLCMNLRLGGDGSWDAAARLGGIASKEKKCGWFSKEALEKRTSTIREKFKNGTLKGGFEGKKHSEDTLIKLRESFKGKRKGELNSQFGTCWVTNGHEVKKIPLSELLDHIQHGFIRGRKLKE